MTFTTGVEPLDARTGDVDPGGLYLLAGPPDSAKLCALLQFLSTGLEAGDRCGLVTGSDPRSVLAQAGRWGLPLEEAWEERRLAILGFEGDFARRLAHAGQPEDVFGELDRALGSGLARIAIDPGAPLWETRADGVMGTRFLDWVADSGATVWATVSGSLDGRLSASTEWVMQGARGVLEFGRGPDGSRQVWVRKLDAPLQVDGPVSVELVPGEGLVAPRGGLARRRTDIGGAAARRLYLLRMAPEVPGDIRGWAEARYEVVTADDPLVVVERLGEGEEVGACLVYLDRDTMARGIQVCRTLRPLTHAPIVLLSDQDLRSFDRTQALDAGADEVMSGSVHLPELERRLARLRARHEGEHPVGARRGAPGEEAEIVGVVDAGAFRGRVGLGADPEHPHVFALVRLRPVGEAPALLGAVDEQMRAEDGDFAADLGSGEVGVVLWGARPGQAQAFLTRLRRALPPDDAEGLESHVLGCPADAGTIRSWASS